MKKILVCLLCTALCGCVDAQPYNNRDYRASYYPDNRNHTERQDVRWQRNHDGWDMDGDGRDRDRNLNRDGVDWDGDGRDRDRGY